MAAIFSGRERPGRIRLDPRTKLGLLFIGNITVLLSPAIHYELLLVASILLLGLLCGVGRYCLKMTVVYFLLAAVQLLGTRYLDGFLQIFLVTFAVFLRKVFPCAMLGGILIATTRVNEFMAAMHRLRIPRSVAVPLAVTLRYFPMIKEEWEHIRDAMNMRGIGMSVRGFLQKPLKTTECIYVPILISAAKLADELAAAAVTRGIDNPQPRTCLQQIGFGMADRICIGWFLLLVIINLWGKGGGS